MNIWAEKCQSRNVFTSRKYKSIFEFQEGSCWQLVAHPISIPNISLHDSSQKRVQTSFGQGIYPATFQSSFWFFLEVLGPYGDFGSFWNFMGPFDRFESFGTFWDILGPFGSCWNILGSFGTLSDLLRPFGTYWDLLKQFLHFRDLLGPLGTFLEPLGTFLEPFRTFGTFLDFSGHLRIF